MPFTDGTFINVSGATSAASGQTIQSTVWNNIHSDYSSALNILADQLAGSTTYKNIAWMNGGLEVWQRGDIGVAASTTRYTADRWYLNTDTNEVSTVSRQTGLSDQSQFCARVQRDSGQTGTGNMIFGYPLDTDEVYSLRGKFVYLRLAIRAGANWSPASGNITVEVRYGTGSPVKLVAGYTGSAAAISQTVALTTITQTLQIISSAVVPITAAQAEVLFSWNPVGTAGANDYFEVDDVELVAVPVADADNYIPDDFEYLPFGVMLEGCKRHYQKTFAYGTPPGFGAGLADSIKVLTQAAEVFGYMWMYIPELRSTPSLVKYHPTTATSSNWYNIVTGGSASANVAVFSSADTTKSIVVFSSVSASNTSSFMSIHLTGSAGI